MRRVSIALALLLALGVARAQEPQDPNSPPPEQNPPEQNPPEQNPPEQEPEQAKPAEQPPSAPATPPAPSVTSIAPVLLGEFAMKVAAGLGLPAPASGFTHE